MTLTWKKNAQSRWEKEEDLFAGKISVAHLRKNIGTKNQPDTYRLIFDLPQVRKDDNLLRFEEHSISDIKKHGEEVIRRWFVLATE